MPGIAGIIQKNRGPVRGNGVELMVKSMLHEPFYCSGTLKREDIGILVGWACHPTPASVCLPIWNEPKDVCLIFTGEHFSNRAHAVSNGIELLSFYRTNGTRFIKHLNGSFSGILIDILARKVVLFNDRYGLDRVYYHENDNGFYFASEAKSLLAILPHLRKLDLQGLGELFTCGCTLQNRTLFPGILQLPGGAAWEFEPGARIRKNSYFDPAEWASQPALSAPAYYEALRDTLVRIVPRYLAPPQTVGMSLTGGVDSRMIMAATAPAPASLPCYTFGGMYRECADVRIARKIARACQQPYRVLALTPQFFAQFPALAAESVYRTDGTMDVSGAVGLFVNQLAREVAPVRLTGNYGGEILRGLVPFRPRDQQDDLFAPEMAPYFQMAKDSYFTERNGHRVSFVAFKQVPWHHYGRFALEQSKLTIRTPFLDNELVELAHRAPMGPIADKGLARRFIAECSPTLAKVDTDRGWPARLTWLPRKVQRFCTEFMPRAEYVYDYGMPHWLAKMDRVLAPLHIERLFLGQQKYAHFRIWYRNQLSAFVKEMLLDPQTLSRSYLNGHFIQKMVSDHVNGYGNYTTQIHLLLTSELIERRLIAWS